MKPFRFRLETLLKLRLAQRDERREALAKALEAEQIIIDRVNETKQEIDSNQADQRSEMKAGQLNVDQLLRSGSQQVLLRAELEKLEQQHRQVVEEMERRREALVEADRGVKVLENLRGRQETEHARLAAKEDAKAMDEIAERYFGRTSR